MTEHTPSINPVLRYRDARAAIEFLQRAFGFEPAQVHEDAGQVVHAELAYGNGLVMVSDEAEQRPWGGSRVGMGWSYVVVGDPDAHYQRAQAAGAEIIRPIEDQDYGSRDYSARDPEGNIWSFGSYAPAVSGQTV